MAVLFLFDKKSDIYLYGASSIGNLFYEYLVSSGCKISGFFDKRFMELDSFMGKQVFDVDNTSLPETCKMNSVIIVSVKNVFEHSMIAHQLSSRGFRNIIYRPLSVIRGGGTNEEKQLYEMFSFIERGSKSFQITHEPTRDFDHTVKLPVTDLALEDRFSDQAILFENGTDIVANIPLELVYTDTPKSEEGIINDVNIFALFPHIDYFRFLMGNQMYSYENYLNFCIFSASSCKDIKITDCWKQNVLNNRQMVYEEMRRSISFDFAFFIRNAPIAHWNKKGYFNLCSGKHRAAFFAALGCKFMPLRISMTDYESFLNIEAFHKLENYIHKKEIAALHCTHMHPYLYQFQAKKPIYSLDYVSWITDYLAREIFEKKKKLDFHSLSVLDLSSDDGRISRHLYKMGCSVVREKACGDEELIKELDSLFYCDRKVSQSPFDTYDIVVSFHQEKQIDFKEVPLPKWLCFADHELTLPNEYCLAVQPVSWIDSGKIKKTYIYKRRD